MLLSLCDAQEGHAFINGFYSREPDLPGAMRSLLKVQWRATLDSELGNLCWSQGKEAQSLQLQA